MQSTELLTEFSRKCHPEISKISSAFTGLKSNLFLFPDKNLLLMLCLNFFFF